MALLSFVALAVVGAILSIAKYIENVRKSRLPAGVKKLPGPKGTCKTLSTIGIL